MRRTTLRSGFLLLLCASILFINAPLRGEISPTPKSSCCAATMTAGHPGASTRHCPPDPLQQKQCCAAYALSLTLFLATNASFISATSPKEILVDQAARAATRLDRPPVPPPRSALG
jgi:hypothetical protein